MALERLSGWPALIVIATGGLTAIFVAAFWAAGEFSAPLSAHMGRHIVLMNAVAPLAAWLSARRWPPDPSGRWLATVTFTQLVVLLVWHAPILMEATHAHLVVAFIMWASLFAVAFAFWRQCFAYAGQSLWMPIAAVAVTGKLFCLFAALFVLAPRVLYAKLNTLESLCGGGEAALDDQHLAGLMMLIACPLSYVAAGIYFAQTWISALERRTLARRL